MKKSLVLFLGTIFSFVFMNTVYATNPVNAAKPRDEVYPRVYEISEAWQEGIALPLVAASFENGVYLYALRPEGKGAVLTVGSRAEYFEWFISSPRMTSPQMAILNHYGNSTQVALAFHNRTGTGVAADELHIVSVTDEVFNDYMYDPWDCASDLEAYVQHNFYVENEYVYISAKTAWDEIEMNLTALLSEGYSEVCTLEDVSFFVDGDHLTYHLTDDGKIKVEAWTAIRYQDKPIPIYFFRINADVSYVYGDFTFSNIRMNELEDMYNTTYIKQTQRVLNVTEPWQKAYLAYLEENGIDAYAIYADDINGDGIPELVIQINDYPRYAQVLYFTGEGVEILDLWFESMWGLNGFLEETRQFILLEFYGHTTGTYGGIENFALIDWTEEGYVTTYRLDRNGGYYENDSNCWKGQGYINGTEVSDEEFEVALEEMYALADKSVWFPVLVCTEKVGRFTMDSIELVDYLIYKLGLSEEQ